MAEKPTETAPGLETLDTIDDPVTPIFDGMDEIEAAPEPPTDEET